MKRCPRCPRSYPDDLNYCLDDGSVLLKNIDIIDDATLVMPPPLEPEPTIAAQIPISQPRPVSQSDRAQSRSGITLLLIGLGIVVFLGAWALVKLKERDERDESQTAQVSSSADSTPLAFNFSPTPSVSPSVLESPSPSPSPSPIPSPSASPSNLVQDYIQPGMYELEYDPDAKDGSNDGLRSIKLQFTFRAEGTYEIQGFVNFRGTSMQDQLYEEERGRYSQSPNRISFSERLERLLDRDTGVWKPWSVPRSGSTAAETIRNVTATGFELRVTNGWVPARKL
jgi:hypothetical protein